MAFHTDQFIAKVREAASSNTAVKQIRTILQDAIDDPVSISSVLGHFEGDDVVLFEDDTVSIHHCRFDPGLHVPPHDHRMTAIIGVYEGAEVNHFYVNGDTGLRRKSTRRIETGEVLSMGPDTIHSVELGSAEESYAIHVYLGNLTTIDRTLYDWDTTDTYPYSRGKYIELLRHTPV